MAQIVVGVDGSPSAADAARWAAQEGRLRNWPVAAVLAWTYLGQPAVGHDDNEFRADYDASDAAAALDAILIRDLPDLAAGIDRWVMCDLPAPALLEASTGADLLVVGARGLSGFRSALLGSVSQQCVHHSTVPVAVIRHPPPVDAGHIVVGIDGSKTAQRALAWALDEARARQAPLVVVHAWQVPLYAASGLGPAVPTLVTLEDEAGALVDRMLGQADTHGLQPGTFERRIVADNPAQAILDAAKGASLVVVGTRGLGGFAGLLLGSVSQHLVHHATCPLVVVPPTRRGER